MKLKLRMCMTFLLVIGKIKDETGDAEHNDRQL